MSNKKEYNRINWTEGMAVHFDMFEQTEDYFINTICSSAAIQLNRNNFGLLPSPDRKTTSSEFDISEMVTADTIEIRLRKCNAVTIGGYRICYNPPPGQAITYVHTFDSGKQSGSSPEKSWDVIITADPYRRVPSGIPDAQETPPRHPNAEAFYGLSVMPEGTIDTGQLGVHHLVIGRIRRNGERYIVDTDFIPPSAAMSSYPALIRYYDSFGTMINDVENASKAIITKIRNRAQNSPIALHIGNICEDMMRYIASIYFSYRNTGIDLAPVNIVNYFSSLAHICYINMDFINKTDREELLRYFYEWSDVKPGLYEELLSNMLNTRYNHNNIGEVMVKIESFLRIISELWLKLSALEYIGQHKENVVIGERTNASEPVKKTNWTILD